MLQVVVVQQELRLHEPTARQHVALHPMDKHADPRLEQPKARKPEKHSASWTRQKRFEPTTRRPQESHRPESRSTTATTATWEGEGADRTLALVLDQGPPFQAQRQLDSTEEARCQAT